MGKSNPKNSPNSFPPKYQKKMPNNDQAIAEKKNCFGFGKKLSNNLISLGLKIRTYVSRSPTSTSLLTRREEETVSEFVLTWSRYHQEQIVKNAIAEL